MGDGDKWKASAASQSVPDNPLQSDCLTRSPADSHSSRNHSPQIHSIHFPTDTAAASLHGLSLCPSSRSRSLLPFYSGARFIWSRVLGVLTNEIEPYRRARSGNAAYHIIRPFCLRTYLTQVTGEDEADRSSRGKL